MRLHRIKLISYKAEKFQALNSGGVMFVLTIEHCLFGFINWKSTRKELLPDHIGLDFWKKKIGVWL